MKSKPMSIFAFLLSMMVFAQGINYKALVKDNGGNVVANQNITVQFQILKGAGMSLTYQETHNPSTDANGIVIVNIGEGTPNSGNYSTIDWGSNDYFLNTKINTGSGLVDLGTNKFKAVPLALHASSVKGEAFKSISGLTSGIKTTDNLVFGSTQLDDTGNANHDARMFFNKSKGAFRAGATNTTYWNNASVGDWSAALGFNTRASQTGSTALGYITNASGVFSTALGASTWASGTTSTAMGQETIASGNYATSMGYLTEASKISSTAIGQRTMALGDYSTAMGNLSIASGVSSTAMGQETLASGINSTAMGSHTTASGTNSMALGTDTSALVDFSTAMGYGSIASGLASTAMGFSTRAIGQISTSIGIETTAESAYSMAIGRYNVGGGSPTTWVNTDPLFEIGNGASSTSKSNAITVLKNGKVGIGTYFPSTQLQITDGSDANLVSLNSGYFVIGPSLATNIVMDNNEIMARNGLSTSILYLQNDGGAVYVGGGLVHASDQRLKQNIESLDYGLKEVLQLRPVSYNWKSNPNTAQKSLGLIAQEVQSILKELVTFNTSRDDTLGVNYTELIPILINAIKEQQEIIEEQNNENNQQNKIIEKLLKRMEQIEANNNQ